MGQRRTATTATVLGSGVLLAVLCVAAPAAADDPKPLELLVTPRGQAWSVGPYGGQECEPTCRFHIAPDRYAVAMGGARAEIPILVSTELTYSPGAPRLRTIAGWTAIGGLAAGGALLGFGIYGYAKACAAGQGCPGLTISRTAEEALIGSAAVLISISVTGAILFAVSGESIDVRDLPGPGATARRSFDVALHPSARGATLDLVKLF